MIYVKYPLIWSQETVDKLWWKHRLCPEEVEEVVFDDNPICNKVSSKSYCVYGQAVSGRYILIILKKRNRDAKYKVITARDMQNKEKQYYRKHHS